MLGVSRCLQAGYGSESDRARSQASGYDYHFTKAADPTVLLPLLADPGQDRPARSQA